MRRTIYIGGFGNGRSGVERVATALREYFEDVDAFTFAQAMNDPDTIRRVVRNANVVTHSAGMISLVGTSPYRIDAFSPPLPTLRSKLVGKAGVKMVRMYTPGIGIRSFQDITAVGKYNRSSTAELLAHPSGNLGRLNIISSFDAIEAAIVAQANDVKVCLGYTDGDEYFRLSDDRQAIANAKQVRIVWLSGIHDELLIRPAETLHAYFAQSGI